MSKQELTRLFIEIESLRKQLYDYDLRNNLVDPSIVEKSAELDEKITEYMKLVDIEQMVNKKYG
ncbi:Spo0E family sporulation regulatory protein-aspartic acid phosphatase [Pontibacillus yanchengensis]|uniref:Spo0E family sporulation regulatory protein-aspartic acid phosphatase n=2 Tax=Pontibacillus yanchengensis TaxID=462910 RepID=A0ACC7VHY5_9BACI|nr:aspartyl-phosphate phosphatase Spo0E family protein [Pontibacillus yanchengensis]MYL34326.1 Spo0E family sporulation regulatory protein-aspartic acid phosphatase [Pontibacillus yanchengensis]MYL53794.1 Spo0E family sporulation regulatory protein-aspartic acid phosphatase [Pontibacillus yanchengensis]